MKAGQTIVKSVYVTDIKIILNGCLSQSAGREPHGKLLNIELPDFGDKLIFQPFF